MKKILVVLFIYSSIIGIAQEPIYNLNINNIHLINFASPKAYKFNAYIDNSYEYYSNNKQMNSTNLFLYHKIFSSFNAGINAGINAEYNYLNNSNNYSNIDFIIDFKLLLSKDFFLKTAINLGARNNNIDYSNLQSKYTFDEPQNTNLSFNETKFNLGFSSIISYKEQEFGFSVNHLNKAELPMKNDKIPIKYTAFIRNRYAKNKYEQNIFYSTITYSYQDSYFLNPTDMTYYYDMLNYFGINLDWDYERKFYSGIAYKYLSNKNNLFSLNLGFRLAINSFNLGITYSPSIMQANDNKSLAQFHQISIYLKGFERHRMGGSVRFL